MRLDAAAEADRIAQSVRRALSRLKRRGVVVGLSGGIDSSVTAALCVRAIGAERVIGLLMPDIDSASDTTTLGQMVGERFGITTTLENITSILEAAGGQICTDPLGEFG